MKLEDSKTVDITCGESNKVNTITFIFEETRHITIKMIQKELTCYYKTSEPTPFLINPNGSMEELQLDKFSSSYLCLVVFRGAMEPVSSSELMDFSNNLTKFQDLDCKLLGLVRDSPMVVQEWLVEPMVGEGEKVSATFPCVSCPNIGEEDFGLIQAVGVPLIKGSPIPTIIITDRENKVRYFVSFCDKTARGVEETLRMVAAIKMVDDAKGNLFAPADWESSEPAIKNTKAGVLEYYQEKYKEEKQKKEDGKQKGLLSKLKEKLGFAPSANCVDETNGCQDNSKEESGYKEDEKPQKVVTREQSKEDAKSVTSKKEPFDKGATGDGN